MNKQFFLMAFLCLFAFASCNLPAPKNKEKVEDSAAQQNDTTKKKKGFFKKLFGKKNKDSSDNSAAETQKAGKKTENPNYMGREQYGDKWAFTFESGILGCEYGGCAIIKASDGKTYAVNGTAKSFAKEKGWIKLDEAWLDDPKNKGLKIYMPDDMISRALENCKK
jgi:hypothetical protein